MAISGLGYNSTTNGNVVFDAQSGIFGVIYDGKLYGYVGMRHSSSPTTYNINGITWTVPTYSQFKPVCLAAALGGRTVGITLFALSPSHDGTASCSDYNIGLRTGNSSEWVGSYPLIAYRTI